jgi:hypothetical protein
MAVMLTLLTTDEFANWFAALDDGAAEDVAATLDVIAQLGTGAEAPESTEWLLWYEHPSMAGRMQQLSESQRALELQGLRMSHHWGAFLGYAKRVLAHLQSPAFATRVAQLTPHDAERVSTALAQIRAAAKARRLQVSEQMRRMSVAKILAMRADEFERFLDFDELRRWYFVALSAAGFVVQDVPAHSDALREIELRRDVSRLRLLYGVDVQRNRGLVVLGEWLDRSFYGDSVRRAEQIWRQFVSGDLPATKTAPHR